MYSTLIHTRDAIYSRVIVRIGMKMSLGVGSGALVITGFVVVLEVVVVVGFGYHGHFGGFVVVGAGTSVGSRMTVRVTDRPFPPG